MPAHSPAKVYDNNPNKLGRDTNTSRSQTPGEYNKYFCQQQDGSLVEKRLLQSILEDMNFDMWGAIGLVSEGFCQCSCCYESTMESLKAIFTNGGKKGVTMSVKVYPSTQSLAFSLTQ
jgi:hypothetical protein